MKKSVLLIENEYYSQQSLIRLLKKRKEFELVATCTTIEKAIEAYTLYNPDVVFLDIELDDGYGFDFVNHFQNFSATIIVTTGESAYAVQSYEVRAFHFLEKPILQRKFNEVMDLYLKESSISPLPHDQKNTPSSIKRIFIPTRLGKRALLVSDIQLLRADLGCVEIFTDSRDAEAVVSKNLPWFIKKLDDTLFIRIHRKYIVNHEKISQVIRHKDNMSLILENGKEVAVSKNNIQSVCKLLDAY
ncbi:MAG: hypothetical protein CMC35_01765 [Flavobacteriaceae bacterium]|nr:hypothetical protein [Flavobacteriaceae bacterium]|tara:strand:+ start:23367 stop:24101 length:735 start_codon:yes stop_codon:yes gene_type:complete